MAKQPMSTDVPGEALAAGATEDRPEAELDSDPTDVTTSTAGTARDVTFRIPAGNASSAVLVGDFNAWSTDATPMDLVGDSFEVTVELEPGEHRYRYLLDGERWENDWHADEYLPNEFGGDDSIRRV